MGADQPDVVRRRPGQQEEPHQGPVAEIEGTLGFSGHKLRYLGVAPGFGRLDAEAHRLTVVHGLHREPVALFERRPQHRMAVHEELRGPHERGDVELAPRMFRANTRWFAMVSGWRRSKTQSDLCPYESGKDRPARSSPRASGCCTIVTGLLSLSFTSPEFRRAVQTPGPLRRGRWNGDRGAGAREPRRGEAVLCGRRPVLPRETPDEGNRIPMPSSSSCSIDLRADKSRLPRITNGHVPARLGLERGAVPILAGLQLTRPLSTPQDEGGGWLICTDWRGGPPLQGAER